MYTNSEYSIFYDEFHILMQEEIKIAAAIAPKIALNIKVVPSVLAPDNIAPDFLL